jgi:hypothetical protein
MPSAGIAFLFGIVAAPLVPKVMKPVLRQAVKAGAGFAFQAKRIAAEVSEDVQDIVAETSAKEGGTKSPSQRDKPSKPL